MSRKISVNLTHLRERLLQSKALDEQSHFNLETLKIMLMQKIENTDFDNAKKDILHFIKDPKAVSLWSQDFFVDLMDKIY